MVAGGRPRIWSHARLTAWLYVWAAGIYGLDRLTNALVLVGQHDVYCTSQRNPALPAMDIRMITQELVHAKELVQSVMEAIRQARDDAAK